MKSSRVLSAALVVGGSLGCSWARVPGVSFRFKGEDAVDAGIRQSRDDFAHGIGGAMLEEVLQSPTIKSTVFANQPYDMPMYPLRFEKLRLLKETLAKALYPGDYSFWPIGLLLTIATAIYAPWAAYVVFAAETPLTGAYYGGLAGSVGGFSFGLAIGITFFEPAIACCLAVLTALVGMGLCATRPFSIQTGHYAHMLPCVFAGAALVHLNASIVVWLDTYLTNSVGYFLARSTSFSATFALWVNIAIFAIILFAGFTSEVRMNLLGRTDAEYPVAMRSLFLAWFAALVLDVLMQIIFERPGAIGPLGLFTTPMAFHQNATSVFVLLFVWIGSTALVSVYSPAANRWRTRAGHSE